ncbi:MAG TPA: RimK family protein [Rhodanobacteraceae bacterium]|nr:RimK family protein [Rhodanobacteraceae bacterium]
MSQLVIVVEKASDWGSYYPSDNVVSAQDYLRATSNDEPHVQVINLCRNYRYLGTGYYVSLLAEARGHRVIPSVRTINALSRRSLYTVDIDDLHQKLARFAPAGGHDTTELEILSCFGQTSYPDLGDLTRQIFEAFPCPLLRIEFKRDRKWRISAIRPTGLNNLDDAQEDIFAQALDRFSHKLWRRPRSPRQYRYDLALLVNPEEKLPPSNRKAIKAFVSAGKRLGIDVDLVTRQDFSRLAEYDGLFIRETTAISDHTYRFAHRAEREGLVVIDDPTSILRCTNKIFLHDLMQAHKLAVPRTEILYRQDTRQLHELGDRLGFPIVLKIPDGSFSRGVFKVDDAASLHTTAQQLFQHSVLLIAQEFLYTEYDWRIGVLNHEPLYACQYFMSRGHWQIYNHNTASHTPRAGGFKTLPLDKVPPTVVRLALKATRSIGNGLYGVDIKLAKTRPVVIEVNDNPSIDAGVEDLVEGETLYLRIMREFLRRMEHRHNSSRTG